MHEQDVVAQPEHKSGMSGWVVAILVAILVAIFALSFSLAPKAAEGEEAFGGTDSVVTEVLEERGVEPWFTPLFEPDSGEVESGLFALQAALGACVLGFALGNLYGRFKERTALATTTAGTPAKAAEPAVTEPQLKR